MKILILFLFLAQSFFGFGQYKFQIIGKSSSPSLYKMVFIKYKSPMYVNYKAYKSDSCLIKNGNFKFEINSQEPVLDLQIGMSKFMNYLVIDSGVTHISILNSAQNKKGYKLSFYPSKSNELFNMMNKKWDDELGMLKIARKQKTISIDDIEQKSRLAELQEIVNHPQEYYSLIRLYNISFYLNSTRFNEINTVFMKLNSVNRTLPIGVLLKERIRDAFALLPNNQLPDFTFYSLEGRNLTNKYFMNDKVFFFFYATWCGPCKKMIPDIKKLHEKFGKDIKFVMVNLDDNKENWQKLINKFEINGMINLSDNLPMIESANVSNLLIDAVPQFLLANNNKIIYKGFINDIGKSEVLVNFLNNGVLITKKWIYFFYFH